MPTSQFHHTGLLVEDLQRSATFYIEALGGRWLNHPVTISGPDAERILGGPEGTSFAFSYIGFASGAIELMQFQGDVRPDWYEPGPRRAWLPHFGVEVDDVPATVAAVEAHGGRRLWPEPTAWGDAKVIYVADPDGNVIELFDVPLDVIVEGTAELFPDARP